MSLCLEMNREFTCLGSFEFVNSTLTSMYTMRLIKKLLEFYVHAKQNDAKCIYPMLNLF